MIPKGSYPSLRGLMLVQFLSIVIGSAVLLLVFYFVSQARLASAVSDSRRQVEPVLQDHEEQWRAWKELGQDDILVEDVARVAGSFPLWRIALTRGVDAPRRPGEHEVVLPRPGGEEAYVVYAALDRARLAGQFKFSGAVFYCLAAFSGLFLLILLASARYIERAKTLEKEFAVGEVARQVAHDIRSPLAALDMASRDLAALPEERRILIRSAVDRIRDIANSLLDRQREKAGAEEEDASPQLLSGLIDSVVTEKRLQFRARPEVEIEARLEASSYGVFARVRGVEFKRVVSNLVDNAVEALERRGGTVALTLAASGGQARVVVRDDGKGISAGVLAKLGRRGETHGKPGGSGLGLYHARSSLNAWGGKLEITSELGKGTAAAMVLPQARAPEWFVSELTLAPGQAVVALDDDESILKVWEGRLRPLAGVELVIVSTPAQLTDWVAAHPQARCLFLLDHELLGFKETGLSLARDLGLGRRAVLVTSRFEEPSVLAGCREIGARLIPKGLAGFVPIRVGAA